jgi:hypothetical protein
MRPLPARVLLSAIAAGALIAGVLCPRAIFFVVAVGALVILATSLLTSRRPLTRALQTFQGRVVDVRLWGAPPPASPSRLTVAAVNALGAGVHVFFSSTHLKVAQPENAQIVAGSIVISSARYVQWNGKKVAPVSGAPAVTITQDDMTTPAGLPAPHRSG